MICVSGCKIFIPTNKNISTNLENESNEALLYTIKIVKPINSNLTAVPFEINYTGRWTIASYTNKKLHIFGVDFNNGDIVSRFPNFVNKSRNNQIYGFFAFPGVSKNQYGILTPDYDYGGICTLYNSMDKKLPNNIDVLDIDYDVNGKMEYKLLSNKLKTEALFNLVIWPQSKISLVIKLSNGASVRSSKENIVFFSRFTTTPITTSSKILAALSIMSRCPNVNGSKEPAYNAFVFMSFASKFNHPIF